MQPWVVCHQWQSLFAVWRVPFPWFRYTVPDQPRFTIRSQFGWEHSARHSARIEHDLSLFTSQDDFSGWLESSHFLIELIEHDFQVFQCLQPSAQAFRWVPGGAGSCYNIRDMPSWDAQGLVTQQPRETGCGFRFRLTWRKFRLCLDLFRF